MTSGANTARIVQDLSRIIVDVDGGATDLLASLRETGGLPRSSHLCADAVVIAPAGGLVLLIRHPVAGWIFPGGHVEDEEPPVDAAVRELGEEAGISAAGTRPSPIALYSMDVPAHRGESAHRHWSLAYLLVIDERPSLPTPISSIEGEVAWHPLTALPGGVNDVVPIVAGVALRRIRSA